MNELAVEATGETVGEAKWKALRELQRLAPGLDREAVRFQVVAEGERGLLGVGSTPARVIATAPAPAEPANGDDGSPPPPAGEESELATRVRALVEAVVGAVGTGSRVQISETEEDLLATCTGGDLGLVIGKHGQTIDALQSIVNAALFRGGEHKPVTVDAAGYRDRRRVTLESIALRAAERATNGERVALEPMTAVERKVVHERLKDVEGVATASEGTEPYRHVVVLPA